jgi:hypothetical protein
VPEFKKVNNTKKALNLIYLSVKILPKKIGQGQGEED